jgi:caspase domain-containing protein
LRQGLSILVGLLIAQAALGGVRVVQEGAGPVDAPVMNVNDSAALFVGVRFFGADETLTEVKYAADDAVDLAYVFSMEPATRLVAPSRVVLALSGEPQKPQSKANLEALREAGAKETPAGQTDVLKALRVQAASVRNNGILIVSFATHGINVEGTQYLLAQSSLLQDRETAVSETKVRDIVANANVPRALVLIDACRKRLTVDTREGAADPRSAAALLRELSRVNGTVVLTTAPGQYAYDDPARQNGVFTATVIDGLRCRARADDRGFITADTLYTYVEDEVLAWVQKRRDPNVKMATQLYSVGLAKKMPLSSCRVNDTAPASPSRSH